MLSNLTESVRQKFNPKAESPGPHRTISFPEDAHPRSKRRLFRDSRPPRDADHDDSETEEESSEESEQEEETPLLPIFSSDHLNALPVFILTLTFRELVIEKCDTVLTWDQLRSPQVSQFLVKPIQQEIKDRYMNAATQYALVANCLQFTKEAQTHPGNSGTNKTRSMLCELIAIKLMREVTARELIDALSYDFDPLQGQPLDTTPALQAHHRRGFPRAARISCIEIAIRAGAKRFLAHPMVVQHLEAIWNGSIVFHSAADSMHRRRVPLFSTTYGTNREVAITPEGQKGVSLYNPKDASLFKLSRLRVPRYRNILSTISFAVLLLLFMAVLQEKSLEVSTLEIIFWVWAAGYMLDEVIGFNEQGFSLYLASFWNTFDVGILLVLFVHLCLRLYGVIIPDTDASKIHVANRAYDVLAASAVLLFPRLFSVLDHYRYFSQLIIAFRMMAADMLAVFVLIIIFCSGFLVALTFAFSRGEKTDNPTDVAYALLQMLMGFTPAAWDRWDEYNWLGKTVLTLFLFICHFVVVTILITVLTNSFMEIVRNANEEHQYLFAINVIANVKSDALFAYVPPLNVLQWTLTPLRYILPFRQYLKVNRTLIKITHLPILWTIYFYERIILQPRHIDRIDLVQSRGRVRKTLTQRLPRLIRAPSVATFRQEAALEEVFRRSTVLRNSRSQDRRKSSNVVSSWMNTNEDAEPPQEQDRTIVDRLEKRRLGSKRFNARLRDFSHHRRGTSVVSDPADMTSYADFFSPRPDPAHPSADITPSQLDLPHQTDADGDDEVTNDDDTHTNIASEFQARDYFHRPPMPFARPNPRTSNLTINRPQHARNVSSATMIYNPPSDAEPSPLTISPRRDLDGTTSPSKSSKKTAKRPLPRPRPILPTKDNVAFRSTPDMKLPGDKVRPSLEMDLISDIGDNKAVGGGYIGALPASFVSRMAIQNRGDEKRNEDMLARIMMTRMNTLEESFRDVVHEVREGMKQATSGLASRARSPERDGERVNKDKVRDLKRKERKEKGLSSAGGSVISADQTRPGSANLSAAEDGRVKISKEIAEEGGKLDDVHEGDRGSTAVRESTDIERHDEE